jgi:hypothetical protein
MWELTDQARAQFITALQSGSGQVLDDVARYVQITSILELIVAICFFAGTLASMWYVYKNRERFLAYRISGDDEPIPCMIIGIVLLLFGIISGCVLLSADLWVAASSKSLALASFIINAIGHH